MRTLTTVSLAIVLILSVISSCAAADYYVNAGAGSDFNAGTSPDDAWQTITHALNTVTGTAESPATIHIAAGTYSASTNGESFPLQIRSYVTLRGESPASTTLDGERQSQVIHCLGTDSVSIEHLGIADGRAEGSELLYENGGCLCSIGSELTVLGCAFSGGRAAELGGCIYISGSKPVLIVDCEITGGGGHDGGGIGASAAILEVRGCTLSNGGGLYGGSIYARNSELKVSSCVITDGHVFLGGGIALSGGTCEVVDTQMWGHVVSMAGGGIYASGSDLMISDCMITRCTVFGWGGAISAWDSTSVKVSNCIFADNWAIDGGALHGRGSTFALNCCTLVDNDAGLLGGMYLDSGSVEAKNCILCGVSTDVEADGDFNISYCCVQGGHEGEGNFDADPLFASGPMGDFYLSSIDAGQEANSPCIDAGSVSSDEVGLHRRTTRTDEALDTGQLDVGFHYPIPGRWIKCLLNSSEYERGELITTSLAIQNDGAPFYADLYTCFVLPDGAIMSFDGAAWDIGIYPWLSDLLLETGFAAGPDIFYTGYIPGNAPLGPYLFAAALTENGTMTWITSCEAPFEVN